MILNFNVEYPPNFFLEFLKITLPYLIGLIPFFYNVLTEKNKKEELKKEQLLKELYLSIETYYLTSISYSLLVNHETDNQDTIKENIFNARTNFRNNLIKNKKYLNNNISQKLNELKNLLFDLDQNILRKLSNKKLQKEDSYDVLKSKYELILEELNKII